MSQQNSPKNKGLCQEAAEPETWGRKGVQAPAAVASAVSFPGDTEEQCAHRESTLASEVPHCAPFPGIILSRETVEAVSPGLNSQASVELVSLRVVGRQSGL